MVLPPAESPENRMVHAYDLEEDVPKKFVYESKFEAYYILRKPHDLSTAKLPGAILADKMPRL